MLHDEFIQLRRESADFLASISELPDFASRLGALDCPPLVADWSWLAVKRVVAPLPSTDGYGLTPGIVHWRGGEDGGREPVQEPVPRAEDMALIETYAKRVERFAAKYVLGPAWAPRAVHDAVRRGSAIRLPRPRPEKLIRLRRAALTYTELAALEREHRPRSELRGSRAATWKGAVEAARARLESRAWSPTQRQQVAQARRYLVAAVEREFPDPGRAADHVEPVDDPLWEMHADRRIADAKRRRDLHDRR